MSENASSEASKRVLQPIERISEVLFGLIMVLTFTGSLSAAEAGKAEIRTMLIGSIGCNLAWALIDAIMYLMSSLSERASGFRTFEAMRRAKTAGEARNVIARAVPPLVAATISDMELERMREIFSKMPDAPKRGTLQGSDWLGALAVFLLVFASTFPVVLPFIFLTDAVVALRVSNVIAIAMMFLAGFAFGRLSGYHPAVTGSAMVVLGAILVALTIALGG